MHIRSFSPKKCLVLFLATILFWANSSNPPDQRTGAPGDNTCEASGCHANPNLDIDGVIALQGLPEVIDPSTAYSLTLQLTITDGDPLIGGFQMTVLDGEDTFIGSFSNPGSNSGISSSVEREYFDHRTAKFFNGQPSLEYTVDWSSPADLPAGPITFYVAANFANGNGANSQDRIKTESFSFSPQMLADNDNDGFTEDIDCNDNDPAINPEAVEIPNNDIDENCDGIVEIIDADSDGFHSDEDCDDNDPAINPDAIEIPNNEVDENCDNIAEVIDADNDGFHSDEDCDDNDPAINPDAIEIPNNEVDENCDNIAEVIDADNDGFHSDEDCDDNDPAINPDAAEIPNNEIDENCDNIAEVIDADNDGFHSDEDCDDNDPAINPGATEVPGNTIDENCDGIDGAVVDSLAAVVQIRTPDGKPVTDVIICFSDTSISPVQTDSSGQFVVPSINPGDSLILTFKRDGDDVKGVSGLDIVIIQRHILGQNLLTDPIQIKAADVNGSGSISAIDIVQIKNIILGFWTEFPNKPSWEFEPAGIVVSGDDSGLIFNIIAIKTGDVNSSANPE